MHCRTHRVRRASPVLCGEIPGLDNRTTTPPPPASVRNASRTAQQEGGRTRKISTFRTSPLSLRPSGLVKSPLLRMGLVLRLFGTGVAPELPE